MPDVYESVYQIVELPFGFEVQSKHRPTVRVELDAETWVWSHINRYGEMSPITGAINYRKLVFAVANRLMFDWEGDTQKAEKQFGFKAHDWARQRTMTALGKRLHQQWGRVIEVVIPPEALAIYRKAFAVSGRTYYQCEHHVQLLMTLPQAIRADFLRYRAAAASLKLAYDILANEVPQFAYDCADDELLKAWSKWRGLYAYEGKPYRALNVTLDQLPGALPVGFLEALRLAKLPRPITDRVELIAWLAFLKARGTVGFRHGWQDDPTVPVFSLFAYASRAEIRTVVDRYVAYTNPTNDSHNASNNIANAVSFMLDAEGAHEHRGGLISLYDRSLEWHRQYHQPQFAPVEYDEATELAKPPFALDKLPKGVRLLTTVKDLVDESDVMQHCVSGYAAACIKGRSFIFHVDYHNQAATVEVSARGQVVQSRGVRNADNDATRYGYRALSKIAASNPLQLVNTEIEVDDDEPIPF